VQISGVGATQIPVALATLRDEASSGVALSAIVRADLERSGLFRMLPADGNLDERSSVDLAAWRGRGADALVAGSVARWPTAASTCATSSGTRCATNNCWARARWCWPADLRLAAHRVADEIHEKLTGERGVNATRIAYVIKAGKRFTLHVTDADGEGGQVALASPEPIISPAWSPDGRQLAYVSFESQKAVVWVQDLGTGQRRMLANFRGSNSAPAWSPDGRNLALTLSQEGLSQLYLLPCRAARRCG
jgi:TolB protein